MSSLFVPITNRGSLSKAVAFQIEEAIRLKILAPGVKLPSEMELCGQFQVSRTTLREALRIMITQGLVTIVKGKGIFVRDLSAESVTGPIHRYLQMQGPDDYALDVIHARQIIEPPIAALAARYHTKADAERLEKDFDRHMTSRGDYSELSQLDIAFHIDIARASENSIIPLILEPIQRLMPQVASSVFAAQKESIEGAVKWHRKILDAILRRDAEGASRAMTQHLQTAEQQIKQMLKRPEGRKNEKIVLNSAESSVTSM